MFEFNYKRIKSRAITAENFTGEKGRGGMATEGTGKAVSADLGRTFKISPSVIIAKKSTFTVCDVKGSGEVRHVWVTCAPVGFQGIVAEFFYDGADFPSVSIPLGKLFAIGGDNPSAVNSLAVTVNPRGGMNLYWRVPFRKGLKITFENITDEDITVYYQIDYQLKRIPRSSCYFHVFYNESLPVTPEKNHAVLAKVRGKGVYVGTFMTFTTDYDTFWGEGEFKFFIDGDEEFPTICGTGTEDYFGGAWSFEQPKGKYRRFTTAYQGLPEVTPEDAFDVVGQRFSMYRWHINDPIYFAKDLRVEVQALGWEYDWKCYRAIAPDITTAAFVYLKKITNVKNYDKQGE